MLNDHGICFMAAVFVIANKVVKMGMVTWWPILQPSQRMTETAGLIMVVSQRLTVLPRKQFPLSSVMVRLH